MKEEYYWIEINFPFSEFWGIAFKFWKEIKRIKEKALRKIEFYAFRFANKNRIRSPAYSAWNFWLMPEIKLRKGTIGMIEVKHIHREGNLETRETLDMERCQNSDYVDKITIRKEGNHTFVVTEGDFEELYNRKLKERCKNF